MLNELKVTNFAIIDQVEINFQKGLNVISGETGSGKSVLLKALGLMMGEKSHADSIKTGETQATVEAAFDISERPDIKGQLVNSGFSTATNAKDVDDTIVVRRIFSTDGKNRVYVNGHLSTLQQLKEIVAPLIEVTGHPAPLIEMTGQHENRNLQSKLYHLEMMDHYLGLAADRNKVTELFNECTTITETLQRLQEGLRTRTQRLDFLTYQRDEIQTVNPLPNEDEELSLSVRRAREATKYYDFIESSEATLYSDEDSSLVRLHRVIQKGTELATVDEKLAKMLEPLQQARTLIEESMYDLREYARSLHMDPDEMNSLEERLSQIRKLQKKFGPSISDILVQLENINAEISTLEKSEGELSSLEIQLNEKRTELLSRARTLHKKRVKGAETLIQSVNAELAELNMKGVIFSVQIRELSEPNSNGLSDIEFTIQNSKNDSPRGLAKYASGGELSRILLALKRVVGHNEMPRTYIFDEVDAGVSGVTAEKVGRKLKAIAKGQQVITVTHLPQVAAFADCHFSIYKVSSKSGSKMQITHLDKEERVKEVARMLSGEKITAASLANAKELIKSV